MSFSTWMSARGQDLAVAVAATKKASDTVVDFTKKTTKSTVEGFEAFKTGYQIKRVDTLVNQTEEKK